MPWLLFSILSYLILAIAFLMDKYLLSARMPNPKLYALYTGFLGVFIVVIAPFVSFYIPNLPQLGLALLAGIVSVLALFCFYQTLQLFETSRVVPAIGAILPLFTLGLIYIFSAGKETLDISELPVFTLLILGSFLITYERSKNISLSSFKFSIITAFFYALYFVLTKYVYLSQPFWNGFILMSVGGFLCSFLFLFSKEVREGIFKTRATFQGKTMFIFFLTKIMGGGGGLLQNWAIFLAPLAGIAIINVLQGTQYAFLLILTVFLSLKFPNVFKEKITKEIVFQKIIAILLIGGGLALLAFK